MHNPVLGHRETVGRTSLRKSPENRVPLNFELKTIVEEPKSSEKCDFGESKIVDKILIERRDLLTYI
jgi:hypothetical protein